MAIEDGPQQSIDDARTLDSPQYCCSRTEATIPLSPGEPLGTGYLLAALETTPDVREPWTGPEALSLPWILPGWMVRLFFSLTFVGNAPSHNLFFFPWRITPL